MQAAKARVEQARLAEERLAQEVTGDVITARESVLTAGEQVQAALTEARSNVIAAIVTYDVAQVALLRALGGVSVPVLLQQVATEGARPGGVTAPRQP